MLKSVNNIYKQKSHEIGNVVKKKCRWRFEILEIFSNPLRRDPPIGQLSSEKSQLGRIEINFSHIQEAATLRVSVVCIQALSLVVPGIILVHPVCSVPPPPFSSELILVPKRTAVGSVDVRSDKVCIPNREQSRAELPCSCSPRRPPMTVGRWVLSM